MQVQHIDDGGVLGQVALDRRQTVFIGVVVRLPVVEGAVVDHGDAVGRQLRRQLVPHPDHVAGAVRRAEGAGGDVLLARGHGIGLAGVAVDDEDLGPLLGTGRELPVPQHRRVQGPAGFVLDVHPVDDAVAVGGAGVHRLGRDAVVRPGLGGRVLRRSGGGVLRFRVRLGGVVLLHR